MSGKPKKAKVKTKPNALTSVRVAENTVADTANDAFCFPFSFRPPDWQAGSRVFGYPRDNGTRKHAGNDLLAPRGTDIYAVADGVLVRDPYPFTAPTDQNPNTPLTHAIEVRHGNLLVRYGEIDPDSFTGVIKKGQKLAKVGAYEMLHIEIYTDGASTAKLTDPSRLPYRRRADLTDPAPYLEQWVNNLPQR